MEHPAEHEDTAQLAPIAETVTGHPPSWFEQHAARLNGYLALSWETARSNGKSGYVEMIRYWLGIFTGPEGRPVVLKLGYTQQNNHRVFEVTGRSSWGKLNGDTLDGWQMAAFAGLDSVDPDAVTWRRWFPTDVEQRQYEQAQAGGSALISWRDKFPDTLHDGQRM